MAKLFSKFNVRSLRSRMLIWAFVFVLPILLLFIYSTNMAAHSYEEQIETNLQQVLIPFAREIDVTLENAKRYVANKRINVAALNDTENELARLTAVQALGKSFSEDLSVYSQVDALFLFEDGQLWFLQNYNRSYASQRKAANYLTAFLQSHEDASLIYQQGYLCFEVDGTYYMFIAIDLPDGGIIGCLFNTDALLEDLRASQINGLSLAIFADRTGSMLHEQFDTRSTRRLNELLSGYLVISEQLSSAAFSLVALLDRDVVFAPFMQLNQGILLALVAAFILFIVYIGFMRGSVILPLNRLVASIKHIQAGNFKPIPIRKNDGLEIQDVYKALNTMTREVEALKIRVYEEKLTQQNTQMQLFQLQLRPHFFLNALNTILSYARANEYALLQKMTLSLATHCRYILYNTWFVSVEEELSYTQNYVDMQSMQHDTKYHYAAQVAESLLDQEIPILAVQIFVENALKHSRERASEIDIRASIHSIMAGDTPCLRITIDDTGVGFTEEMLALLNSQDNLASTNRDHGIGIENVRKRLEILYGDQADIIFANNGHGGAHVEMRLPMERQRK